MVLIPMVVVLDEIERVDQMNEFVSISEWVEGERKS